MEQSGPTVVEKHIVGLVKDISGYVNADVQGKAASTKDEDVDKAHDYRWLNPIGEIRFYITFDKFWERFILRIQLFSKYPTNDRLGYGVSTISNFIPRINIQNNYLYEKYKEHNRINLVEKDNWGCTYYELQIEPGDLEDVLIFLSPEVEMWDVSVGMRDNGKFYENVLETINVLDNDYIEAAKNFLMENSLTKGAK